MSKSRFDVTYEIVTEFSASDGEAEERGFIAENIPLRDALQMVFETRTSRCNAAHTIEPNDSDIARANWITVYNGIEFETGAWEKRSIHFPKNLTSATRIRIAKLAGVIS